MLLTVSLNHMGIAQHHSSPPAEYPGQVQLHCSKCQAYHEMHCTMADVSTVQQSQPESWSQCRTAVALSPKMGAPGYVVTAHPSSYKAVISKAQAVHGAAPSVVYICSRDCASLLQQQLAVAQALWHSACAAQPVALYNPLNQSTKSIVFWPWLQLALKEPNRNNNSSWRDASSSVAATLAVYGNSHTVTHPSFTQLGTASSRCSSTC